MERSFSDESESINARLIAATGKSMNELTNFFDSISRQSGYGNLSNAYQLMLRGINHRGIGNPVRLARENQGITFFTRPNFNLTDDNIVLNRMLSPLSTGDELSLQRYVRAVLDVKSSLTNSSVKTPLFDKTIPYIPVLTNNCLTMSGWPDWVLDNHTSQAGIYREAQSQADGVVRVAWPFDLTVNLRNVEGNILLLLISTWVLAMSLGKTGDMEPHVEDIVEQELNYCTSIIQFRLDPSRRFITNWAATPAAWPTTVPWGSFFNFTADETFVSATEQFAVNFHCNIAEYNDPITLYEFNKRTELFNPDFAIIDFDDRNVRLAGENAGRLIRIKPFEMKIGNYYGRPIVHPTSQELMWFATKEEYEEMRST